jgi:hypothetical protein
MLPSELFKYFEANPLFTIQGREAPVSTTSSPIDLAQLRALERAATPAPWVDDPEQSGIWSEEFQRYIVPIDDMRSNLPRGHEHPPDLALIAAVRNALPGLLDELGRLRAAEALCREQAEEEGLWFVAEHITEAYLQQELRKLHAAIEGKP